MYKCGPHISHILTYFDWIPNTVISVLRPLYTSSTKWCAIMNMTSEPTLFGSRLWTAPNHCPSSIKCSAKYTSTNFWLAAEWSLEPNNMGSQIMLNWCILPILSPWWWWMARYFNNWSWAKFNAINLHNHFFNWEKADNIKAPQPASTCWMSANKGRCSNVIYMTFNSILADIEESIPSL